VRFGDTDISAEVAREALQVPKSGLTAQIGK
jgi:hypothetical protein